MITNVRAATGDSADDHITYLQEYGVPIYVCTPCAKSRQISESDLINGTRMATGLELWRPDRKSFKTAESNQRHLPGDSG